MIAGVFSCVYLSYYKLFFPYCVLHFPKKQKAISILYYSQTRSFMKDLSESLHYQTMSAEPF